MADKSMDQLRALLKSYEERTAKLQVAVKPVHDEGERRRRACGERLKTVVRGVLERFMDALKNAAHTRIDQAVTAGRLTADQANTQKTQIDSRIDQMVNQATPQGQPGRRGGAEVGV